MLTTNQGVEAMTTTQTLLRRLCIGDAGTMTIRQLSILASLHEQGSGRDFGEVAQELELSRPAMSRSADRLSDLGLISKTVPVKDGRKVILTLTAKGRSFCVRYLSDAA